MTRARNGEQQAWDALVERYAPLIWSICRKHRLGGADADDAGQRVRLQLVDHLDQVWDPVALPGRWPPRPRGNSRESGMPRTGHPSIEFTDEAPDDEQPRLGAWLELRADDQAAVLHAALRAGLTDVKHPGHPYYFMIPGGQVFTIAPTS